MKLGVLDAVVGAALVLLGLYVVWQAVAYGILADTVTGPGFFPLLSGLMILVGAGGAVAGQLRRSRVLEGRLTAGEVAPVAAIILATLVFLLLVETVGMILLTPVYVFAVASAILPPRGPRIVASHVAVAIGFTAFAWLLFVFLLNVPLPRGILAPSY